MLTELGTPSQRPMIRVVIDEEFFILSWTGANTIGRIHQSQWCLCVARCSGRVTLFLSVRPLSTYFRS